jgi:hypothetical protein
MLRLNKLYTTVGVARSQWQPTAASWVAKTPRKNMRQYRRRTSLLFALMMSNGAVLAQSQEHQIAMAQAAGYRYENAVYCKAPAELLSAYKAMRKAKLPAAGAHFEPAFEAGRMEASSKRKQLMNGIVPVADEKVRQSLCINGALVERMRAEVAKNHL